MDLPFPHGQRPPFYPEQDGSEKSCTAWPLFGAVFTLLGEGQKIEKRSAQAFSVAEGECLGVSNQLPGSYLHAGGSVPGPACFGSKATLVDVDTVEAPAVQACGKLHSLAARLARGNVNEEAIGYLKQLSAFGEQYSVLVQFLRLEDRVES